MSDYKLTTYSGGRVTGTGDYDELYDAIGAANEAMHNGPVNVEEFEITTDVERNGKTRNEVLVYGCTEDAWEDK